MLYIMTVAVKAVIAMKLFFKYTISVTSSIAFAVYSGVLVPRAFAL
jgi:hypothetical protein